MWEQMRNQLNELHKKLLQKPDSEKMGYAVCPGGILNAYREGDITFSNAVESLNEWALSQGAKNTEEVTKCLIYKIPVRKMLGHLNKKD